MANPTFIPIAFATNGLKNTIQKTRQPTQDAQDMTWNDGSPLITLTPIEDGGKPPKGQDFNGVINAISENVIYNQNGERYKWSQDVIENYGGYQIGAIVQSDDASCEYRSIVANNTVNPNNGLAGSWIIYSGSGSIPVATSTTAGVTTVVNNLTSTNVSSALSAAQGKVLSDTIFNGNQAVGGYQWVGKTLLQWGRVDFDYTPSESQVDINFPMPFNNNVLNVSATRVAAYHSSRADGGVLLLSANRTGASFSLQTFNSSNISELRGFTWFAIGF